jgi:hypothetical protein
VECPHCQFVVAPGEQAVDGGTCPNCERPFRSQPTPLNSDMAMRDMPEPGMDDSGGNPLQEGILGDYQHPSKRDESFASVQAGIGGGPPSADYDSIMGDHELAQRGVPFPEQCRHCEGNGCQACGGQGVVTPTPDFEVTGVLPPEDGSVRARNERMDKEALSFDDVGNAVGDAVDQAGQQTHIPVGPAVQGIKDVADGGGLTPGEAIGDVSDAAVDPLKAMAPDDTIDKYKWPILGGAALAAGAMFAPGVLAGGGAAAEGGAAAGGGGALGAGGIGGLMRNALMAHGALSLGQDALGSATQGMQPQYAQPQVQPDSYYSRTGAEEDLKSPGSQDSVLGDEDNDYDSKQHDDGDDDKFLHTTPDVNDMGGSDEGPDGFKPDSDAMKQLSLLFPLVLHYALSPESGEGDGKLQQLHQALDSEHPGYLDKGSDDEGHRLLMMIIQGKPGGDDGLQDNEAPHDPVSEDDEDEADQLKAAALEAHTFVALGGLLGEECANCGSVLDPSNGACPQCAFKNPLHMPQPTNPDFKSPQQMAVAKVAVETQGPITDEQKALLAEFLIQDGRQDEVPQMLLNPAEYADELAQISGKDDPPTPPDDPAPAPPPVDPSQGGGMPMPGMSAPGPGGAGAGPMMAAISRYAASVDVAADKCPECGSHTTGYSNEDGDCQCHSCGHKFKGEGLNNLDKTADHDQNVNMDNEIGVPAAEQSGQEDVEREQDSGHAWVDDQGQPLKVGQEYEMYSSNYDIPDIIRIERVKPEAIEYTLTGEYGLEHRTEVSWEEAQLENLSFVPSHGQHDPNQEDPGLDQNMEDVGRPDPGMTETDLSTPHVMSAVACPQCGSQNYNPYEACRDCGFTPQAGNGLEDPREPILPLHEGAEKEAAPFFYNEDDRQERPSQGQWALPEQARGVAQALERCPNCGEHNVLDGQCQSCGEVTEPDITSPYEQIHGWEASTKAKAQETGPDWLASELRTAGAKFTPFEQRDFIDEQGVARNSDKLDLTGTHYEEAPDEHFLFGL